MRTTESRTAAREEIVKTARESLGNDLGYQDVEAFMVEGEACTVARVGGHPTVLVYVPAEAGPVSASGQELAIQLGAVVEGGPSDYVWATATGKLGDGFIYSWLPANECQVSRIPTASELSTARPPDAARVKPKMDPARFKELQREFDELHEQVYASREPIDGSNDLTAQLCKCIFLKMHLERHRDFRPDAGGPLFEEIFRADYIRKHGDQAVEQIKRAFEVARALPEYCLKDDLGHDFRIFDPDDFIKFQKPETYARVAEMLNRHQLTNPEETGLEDDVIGRAFDVMLRAKFESKGGMGIYLTPQQVRDAMVQMAFHDILREEPGVITRRDPKSGRTQFRVGDPCCGSAGFLITAMREVRKQVDRLLGLSARQRADLLSEVFAQGFEGADSSPNMVLMGRINMALHGDPKARVFRVANSLTAEIFVAESFDLILTNPPFKKGGITDKDHGDVIAAFRSDIDDGRPKMTGSGLALGAKPNGKGVWSPVNSVDPAVLFIDRCLQLLKPGGRLLLVVPDGVLCNSQDRYVREYLMGKKDESTGRFVGGKAIVRAVVSLPAVTFRLSGAGAKTSFLYLQKKRAGDEQGPVFMAVANGLGFDVKQNKEVLTGENDLVTIVEAYKAGPETAAQHSAGLDASV
jgi:type I restriction enzyme M protein